MTNIVVLVGRLGRPPEARELPSGQKMVTYEVVIDRPRERADFVPVLWVDAPAGAGDHDPDERVLVVGRVRRRFFLAGGRTESRTEVVAEAVVDARDEKQVTAALQRAQGALWDALR